VAETALKGIRVLDFTWIVAGPVATRILADQGAEVIKLERKQPSTLGARRVGLQGGLNRNKLSVAINMGKPQGIELARRLAAISDIVIDNFSARVMRQWTMDYESLSAIKPDIICLSMSGFGHTGPRSNDVSFGPTLQALAGYTAMMAGAHGNPAGWGYSYADMVGGQAGALAALVALWHRARTGRGQFVDLSQFESVASLIGPALLDAAVNDRAQKPSGSESQEAPAAPSGVYRCCSRDDDDDRWLAISVRSHSEWRRFVTAIGSPTWASDERFRTLFLRMRNREALDGCISQWTIEHRAEEAMSVLQDAGIAAGVVANGADLCERDPQLQDRGFWMPVTLPDGTTTQVPGVPFKLSHTPATAPRVAPAIGDDNDYVLGDLLGLGRAEREALGASGAIWT
jgi:crotonobetainyl-CoA:carnitine CoA-transferase CaiB-like acyl-CoA transferase